MALTVVFAQPTWAQCVEHPAKKTALKLDNQTRYDLTFFVDDDEKGVGVASRTMSAELEVEPGEHLLRARAVVKGESVWVWVINEVQAGQVCTWTIDDPSAQIAAANKSYEPLSLPNRSERPRARGENERYQISNNKEKGENK